MVVSSLAFGALLTPFSPVRLIQVIQGAAVVAMALNTLALWKQEARQPPPGPAAVLAPPPFKAAWQALMQHRRARRLLVAVGLGSAAFSMQDVLLEPYGAQILHLGVGATSTLTALMAGGSLLAFGLAARWLARGADGNRLAAYGALAGVAGFAAVVFAEPLQSAAVFRAGTLLVGFGAGLFAVTTLSEAMALDSTAAGPHAAPGHGLALGAWGAVQATASGCAIALGGALRDIVGSLAPQGWLGPALAGPATGYSVVYHLEIALLFATLVAIGPLVRPAGARPPAASAAAPHFGLAEFPG
jgi:BCD family chlorophyll transporter-like MFS transporter